MTASATLLVRSFQVGKHTVTVTVPKPQSGKVVTMVVEWEPVPEPGSLTTTDLAEYRQRRNDALAEIGVPTLVVDL